MTGNFWNVDNPLKPWGWFDPNGVYDIPVDWTDWLAALADPLDTYGSHTIICALGLQCVASTAVAGKITVRIRKDPAEPLIVHNKYGFTTRITTTNGQIEDQTLYLRVMEK